MDPSSQSGSSVILVAVLCVAIVLVALNLYVSVKLLRSDAYTRLQKALQLVIVWLLPVVGPILVLTLIQGAQRSAVDRGYTEPRENLALLIGSDIQSRGPSLPP